MVISLIGCSAAGSSANTNLPASDNSEVVENADDSAQSSTEEESEETETAKKTDYSTGNPWINSNYLQNVIDNPDVNLKDNFDLAVNGQWVIDNPIKEGKTRNSYLMSFEDELNNRLTSILEDKTYDNNHDADLVQSFYNSFLDWGTRDSDSLDSFLPYLERIEAIKSYDDLVEYYGSSEVSLSYPFGYEISANPVDSDAYCISVYGTAFFLEDAADYDDLDNLSDYSKLVYDCSKKKVATVLSYCGYSDDEIDSIFDGAIEFEKATASHSYTNDEIYLTETMTTVRHQLFTEDEIKDYNWYRPLNSSLKALGLTDDIPTYLLYDKMDYFENLDSFVSEENIEIIKDYMLAHTASESIAMLNKDCYYAALDIMNELRGSKGYRDEKIYALNYTSKSLGWPLSKLYTDKYVTKDDKETVQAMINDIVDEYKVMLESEDFLSDATKKEAVNKLNHIRIKCMYPDNWDDFDYSKLELNKNYFENNMAIKKFDLEKQVADFYKPVDKEKWTCTPITMNAFYYPVDNSINILPGLIGDVLYNKDMPVEEAYAKLGTVIGHEISHAFDPNGATYDADGNTKDWWTKEDYANFKKLTDKLVSYYDNIKIWDGLNCNGELDKTEACADMAGVASILSIAKNIDGFDYDLFFNSYAKTWASNWTPEYMHYVASYDSHPLNYLRTNVTVAQFDEFYDTYDIKEGDGMYIAPEDRVKIW